jgi:hypothetical protein
MQYNITTELNRHCREKMDPSFSYMSKFPRGKYMCGEEQEKERKKRGGDEHDINALPSSSKHDN